MSKKRGRRAKSQAEREYNQLLGARIEEARKKAGMQAKDLARAIGVIPSQLYWYEIGRSPVAMLTIVRIARILEIPVTALIPITTSCGLSLRGNKKLLV
jgi:transcriptional regulator with XRE-family HTH domain